MTAEVKVVVGSLDPWSNLRVGVCALRVEDYVNVQWKDRCWFITFIYGTCVS